MTTRETTRNKVGGKAIFSLSNVSSPPSIIEGKLRKLSGVKDATVNCVTNMVLVYYDPEQLDSQDIRTFLRRLG